MGAGTLWSCSCCDSFPVFAGYMMLYGIAHIWYPNSAMDCHQFSLKHGHIMPHLLRGIALCTVIISQLQPRSLNYQCFSHMFFIVPCHFPMFCLRFPMVFPRKTIPKTSRNIQYRENQGTTTNHRNVTPWNQHVRPFYKWASWAMYYGRLLCRTRWMEGNYTSYSIQGYNPHS